MLIWLGPLLGVGLFGLGVFGALWRRDARARGTSLLLVANGAIALLLMRSDAANVVTQPLVLLAMAVVISVYALLSHGSPGEEHEP